ncbi:zinc ABC transporter substrate-binding protein [Marinobacter zhanjiangensis]|uniref:High-affinity zinc uptake system protein ZnuA n=1 Tax=Marinobacter zhanjiangensis TaxID=578215 RepID=A0ABQ3AQK3_9GAMM|nr:zinc ABC transporter substrate-binding protein [Marinobacter zhanjiangensis]GGY64216.1 zinc ABC transporter substrate-binding protein [Marinobacter zhanjiangensis]
MPALHQIGRTLLFLTCSLTLSTQALAAEDRPQVVTSLKPLELLVRAVAHDQVDVTTLVPSGSSPHTYQLRPSERQRLASADQVFWVGPGMENFLTRLLTGPDFRDRTMALGSNGDAEDDHGDEHHDHGHDHEEEHPPEEEKTQDQHGGHDHGEGEDPHIWLDPTLARDMARDIADQLKTLEGVDDNAIDENLASFDKNVKAAEETIRQQLAPARDLDLFTYHDAFRRFAEHYGLTIAGVLTLSPERSPGARHLAEVQGRLARAEQTCLLTEPQFDRQWWDSLMGDVDVPISTWDPLAGDIEASPRGYVLFQQNLAEAVLHCLPEQAQQ